MANINILDCTLRDGGYINNWAFSNDMSTNLIDSLVKAKIEFIELGYINKTNGECKDTTMFSNLSCIENIVTNSNAKYLVMLNVGDFDVEDMDYNPNIFGIRLAFRKDNCKKAFEDAKKIIAMGFKVFMQPMITLSYSDKELLEMMSEFNKIDIYAFYIVDSFGAMQSHDVSRLALLIDNNLKKDVKLGLHAHNNLQLAYSNAVTLVQAISDSDRELIIDSSVLGMGRGAGNLNTELFADYLVKNFHKDYEIKSLLDIIDNYISIIHKENYWGYSAAHYISAIYNCHPNYSTYLSAKEDIAAKDIENIISNITESKKHKFDKKYIEDLYIDHNLSKYSDYENELFKRPHLNFKIKGEYNCFR